MDPKEKIARALMAKDPSMSPDLAARIAENLLKSDGAKEAYAPLTREANGGYGTQPNGYDVIDDGPRATPPDWRTPRAGQHAPSNTGSVPGMSTLEKVYDSPDTMKRALQALEQKKARVAYYEQLKARAANGEDLGEEESGWMRAVHGAKKPIAAKPVNFMEQAAEQLARKRTLPVNPQRWNPSLPAYPSSPMPDGSKPDVQLSPQEAAQFGMDPQGPTYGVGIGDFRGEIAGHQRGPVPLSLSESDAVGMDEMGRATNSIGVEIPHDGRDPNVRTQELSRQQAARLGGGGAVYSPGTDQFVDQAYSDDLERFYGQAADIYEQNGGFPEGFFQNAPEHQRAEFERHTQELLRRRQHTKQYGSQFGVVPGPSV